MIEKLTQAQEDQIPVYVDKWIKIGLDITPITLEEAVPIIHNIQTEILNKPKTLVTIVPNPLQACLAVYELFLAGEQVGNQVRNQVWNQVRNHGVEEQVRNQVWGQIWEQIWEHGVDVREQILEQVEEKIWDRVWRQVRNQVREQVWEHGVGEDWGFLRPHLNGQYWASWFAFYDFMEEVVGVKGFSEKYHLLRKATKLNSIYFLDSVCILSQKPKVIKMINGRLHSDKGPAIEFDGDFSIYCLNGIRVPKEIVETPAEKLEPKLLFTEENVEVRREILTKIGIERVLQKLGGKKLSSWREYDLYELKEIDIEPVHFLTMKCPSTQVLYGGRVPPEINKARDGAKWRNMGIDPEEFIHET